VAVMMVVPSAGTLARRHYTSFSSHSETFDVGFLTRSGHWPRRLELSLSRAYHQVLAI